VERVFKAASTFANVFRLKSRCRELLRAAATGTAKVLLRHIPTRMLTLLPVTLRLVSMRFVLNTVVGSAEFIAWEKDTPKAQLNDVVKVKELLSSISFWLQCDFVIDVVTPLFRALRFFDRRGSRSRDVHRVLGMLVDAVASKLGEERYDEISPESKAKVAKVLAKAIKELQTPGHVAAYVVNPMNYEAVKMLSDSMVMEDTNEWRLMKDDFLSVGAAICKRDALIIPGLEGDPTTRICSLEEDLERYVTEPSKLGLHLDRRNSPGFTPETWFRAAGKTPFLRVAMILMCQPASTSDIERNHKVEARIHTVDRSRLTKDRTDLLMLGNIALNSTNLSPSWTFAQTEAWIAGFATPVPSSAELQAVQDYYDMADATEKELSASLQAPVTDVPVVAPGATIQSFLDDRMLSEHDTVDLEPNQLLIAPEDEVDPEVSESPTPTLDLSSSSSSRSTRTRRVPQSLTPYLTEFRALDAALGPR
ncbi:MAG: hypothetical protein OK454_04545, partial [Thaumarchaeota archaeon]|nr:hypothetical protein [Nitrososphaerota archaeon]